MSLSQAQQYVLIGLLLGDGYLEFNKFKASRLQVKQSNNKQEYVSWLYDHFNELVKTSPKQRTDTLQWYFSTRSLVELEVWRQIFYQDKRKIVPRNIKSLLVSPLTLAVWFMDDGTLDFREKSHCSFTLSTDSFSVEEVFLLQEALLENFGIKSSIQTPRSRGKQYTKLYIGKKGRDIFLKNIRPYILNCFAYKLPPIIA